MVFQKKVPSLGREKRFRIATQIENDLMELACADCGHTFNVRTVQQNYFFTCPMCHKVGNLPGVLAAKVDIDSLEFPKDEREQFIKDSIAAIQAKFTVPETPMPELVREHKQSN